MVAYFLTWTTYGTWLPGDLRGWINRHQKGIVQAADSNRQKAARTMMRQEPVRLNQRVRHMVDQVIRETAERHGWMVHAINVRSNHVHVVLSAYDKPIGEVLRVLKACASHSLNRKLDTPGRRWWSRQGSMRILPSRLALEKAIVYVNGQDTKMRGWSR